MSSTTNPRDSRFLLEWLGENRADALEGLWKLADDTRAQFVGGEVGVWGTVKLSNHCDDQCAFCGLRAGNDALPRFRLTTNEVLAAAKAAAIAGSTVIVLQSGRDAALAGVWVADLVRRIREETGLPVALALGERAEAELAAWRHAGAESYLLRFITANTTLYQFLHCGGSDDPRRRMPVLATLKKLGYRVGSGVLVGFPGQSVASLVDDLELIRKLDLDIVLAGPYVWPAELSQGRPAVQNRDPNSALAVMKVLALARQLCPNADIPSTTALAAVGGADVHALALARGANIVVVDFTPVAQREQYGCYPGRSPVDEHAWNSGSLRVAIEHRRQWPIPVEPAGAGPDGAALPPPRPICVGVCMGSSCFSRGNNRTVAAVQNFIAAQHAEGRVVLEGHLCAGQCKQGPNVTIAEEPRRCADAAAVIENIRQRLQSRE